MKNLTIINFAISTILGLLMLYSGSSKLLDFHNFTEQIDKSPFLYNRFEILPVLLITIETVLGVLLLTRYKRKLVLYFHLYLMSSFTVYIYLMMQKASYLPCACMGIFESLSWQEHLWVNIILVVLNLIAIFIGTDLNKEEQYKYHKQRITGSYNTIRRASPSGATDQMDNGRNSQYF